MTKTGSQTQGAFALSDSASERLLSHLTAAAKAARRSSDGEVLAAVTVDLPAMTDPSAVVVASRQADEPWFCFEQPDRDGAALAALGCAKAIEASGSTRFAQTAKAWAALTGSAQCDSPGGTPGSGPVAVGGFAFADDGGTAPHCWWRGPRRCVTAHCQCSTQTHPTAAVF